MEIGLVLDNFCNVVGSKLRSKILADVNKVNEGFQDTHRLIDRLGDVSSNEPIA